MAFLNIHFALVTKFLITFDNNRLKFIYEKKSQILLQKKSFKSPKVFFLMKKFTFYGFIQFSKISIKINKIFCQSG